MNPFEMQVGLGNVPPQPVASAPPTSPPTEANPFPGSGITIAQGPTDPAFAAQQDREEAAGAGNLMNIWKDHDRMRAEADNAVELFKQGKLSEEDTANIIIRYNEFRDANRRMLEARPVNRGNPIWNWIFGSNR